MESLLRDLQKLGSVVFTGKTILHLKLSDAELCIRLYPRRATIRLQNIWVATPQKGRGTAIMQTLCDAADQHAIRITLLAYPFGDPASTITRQKLVSWYRQFGFLVNYNYYDDQSTIDFTEGVEMLREPRPLVDL